MPPYSRLTGWALRMPYHQVPSGYGDGATLCCDHKATDGFYKNLSYYFLGSLRVFTSFCIFTIRYLGNKRGVGQGRFCSWRSRKKFSFASWRARARNSRARSISKVGHRRRKRSTFSPRPRSALPGMGL